MIRRWLPQDAVFAPSELEGLNQTLKIVTVRFAYISWGARYIARWPRAESYELVLLTTSLTAGGWRATEENKLAHNADPRTLHRHTGRGP
jgi:hypothetical protein